jgi:hypothetical protein
VVVADAKLFDATLDVAVDDVVAPPLFETTFEEDDVDADATEMFLPLPVPVSSADDFFVGISDFCCSCCCNELDPVPVPDPEPDPDPFLAGAFGFPPGDPLRYSRLDDVTADDVTADDDVTVDDEIPFCDVFDVKNDDFANVVLSGDLLRRSVESEISFFPIVATYVPTQHEDCQYNYNQHSGTPLQYKRFC